MVQIINAPPMHPPITAITVIVVLGTLALLLAPVFVADSVADSAVSAELVTVLKTWL